MVDYGYAVVGGDRCAGSALPAMLGGFTRWHAELNATTVLGYTCLPCPAQGNNDAQWPAAKIRIEVAAGYKERKASEPWLLTLITEMVPLTVSVDLRWVSAQRCARIGSTTRWCLKRLPARIWAAMPLPAWPGCPNNGEPG